MKVFLLTGFLFLTASVALAKSPTKAVDFFKKNVSDPVDWCEICTEFYDEAINTLLDIIVDVGIEGGCDVLCAELTQRSGSQILGAVCDILCDIEGINEFEKLLNKADFDDIYFCQELGGTCPINDNANANVTSFAVQPTSGPVGTAFVFTMVFSTTNGTGPGEIHLHVDTVDKFPIAQSFYNPARKPGTYTATFTLNAEPGEFESFQPGEYLTNITICNGEYDSKKPHSKTLATARTKFHITKN